MSSTSHDFVDGLPIEVSLVVPWVVDWPSGLSDNHEAGSAKLLVVDCPSNLGGNEVWSAKLHFLRRPQSPWTQRAPL